MHLTEKVHECFIGEFVNIMAGSTESNRVDSGRPVMPCDPLASL